MSRDEKQLNSGHSLAVETFGRGAQKCKTDDELAGFVQMMCIMASKTIRGMDGKKFQNDFLISAMNDNEVISPMRVQ